MMNLDTEIDETDYEGLEIGVEYRMFRLDRESPVQGVYKGVIYGNPEYRYRDTLIFSVNGILERIPANKILKNSIFEIEKI